MLQITADVFSGRPNPVSVVSDEAEVRATLRELTADRSLLADAEPAQSGLGFRGFWIEILSDELAQDFGLRPAVYLAVGPQARGARVAEHAERLIGLMERGEAPTGAAEGVLPLETPVRDFLTTQLEFATRLERQSRVSLADEAVPVRPEEAAAPAVTCTIELGAFNPGFWNNDPNVRRNNNCYNYASNWRTNTFAQPGRGCGSMYTAITCAEVTRAALCDGMHHRFDCFPDTEKPRYLVALVVAPGPGFIDYHWFRRQKEGFWGHKPGGTAARNVDNSGVVITDPQTADRGPYTLFCGFFYGCNSQRQRIR
jgi:hypothetical protein